VNGFFIFEFVHFLFRFKHEKLAIIEYFEVTDEKLRIKKK